MVEQVLIVMFVAFLYSRRLSARGPIPDLEDSSSSDSESIPERVQSSTFGAIKAFLDRRLGPLTPVVI